MTSDKRAIRNTGVYDVLVIVAVTAATIWTLLEEGASGAAFLMGGIAWLISFVLKFSLHFIVVSKLESRAPLPTISVVSGIFSATLELGAAAWLLSQMPFNTRLTNTLAFGVGAACAENILVLAEALLARADAKVVEAWTIGAQNSFSVRHSLAVERLGASLMHVGSRGLVAMSINWAHAVPAAVAFMVFAAVDGGADYGVRKSINWYDPRVHAVYFGCIWGLAVLQIFFLAYFW